MFDKFITVIVLTVLTVANADAQGFAPWRSERSEAAATRSATPVAGFGPWRQPTPAPREPRGVAGAAAVHIGWHGFAPWTRGGA